MMEATESFWGKYAVQFLYTLPRYLEFKLRFSDEMRGIYGNVWG